MSLTCSGCWGRDCVCVECVFSLSGRQPPSNFARGAPDLRARRPCWAGARCPGGAWWQVVPEGGPLRDVPLSTPSPPRGPRWRWLSSLQRGGSPFGWGPACLGAEGLVTRRRCLRSPSSSGLMLPSWVTCTRGAELVLLTQLLRAAAAAGPGASACSLLLNE